MKLLILATLCLAALASAQLGSINPIELQNLQTTQININATDENTPWIYHFDIPVDTKYVVLITEDVSDSSSCELALGLNYVPDYDTDNNQWSASSWSRYAHVFGMMHGSDLSYFYFTNQDSGPMDVDNLYEYNNFQDLSMGADLYVSAQVYGSYDACKGNLWVQAVPIGTSMTNDTATTIDVVAGQYYYAFIDTPNLIAETTFDVSGTGVPENFYTSNGRTWDYCEGLNRYFSDNTASTVGPTMSWGSRFNFFWYSDVTGSVTITPTLSGDCAGSPGTLPSADASNLNCYPVTNIGTVDATTPTSLNQTVTLASNIDVQYYQFSVGQRMRLWMELNDAEWSDYEISDIEYGSCGYREYADNYQSADEDRKRGGVTESAGANRWSIPFTDRFSSVQTTSSIPARRAFIPGYTYTIVVFSTASLTPTGSPWFTLHPATSAGDGIGCDNNSVEPDLFTLCGSGATVTGGTRSPVGNECDTVQGLCNCVATTQSGLAVLPDSWARMDEQSTTGCAAAIYTATAAALTGAGASVPVNTNWVTIDPAFYATATGAYSTIAINTTNGWDWAIFTADEKIWARSNSDSSLGSSRVDETGAAIRLPAGVPSGAALRIAFSSLSSPIDAAITVTGGVSAGTVITSATATMTVGPTTNTTSAAFTSTPITLAAVLAALFALLF